MYQVGDVVRLIPESYYDLSKAGLLQRECWKEADSMRGQDIMLGGRYDVLEVKVERTGNFYTLVERSPGAGPYDDGPSDYRENFLVLDKDVENCPYKVGDKVLFRPKCSAIEVKFLTMIEARNLRDPDWIHEVRAIINSYYIVVDYEIADSHSYPSRWIDFEPA